MLTAAMTSTPTRRVGSFGSFDSRGRRSGVPAGPARYDRPVIPLLVIGSGLALLAAGWLVLRSMGPGARIGRLLAATRIVPVAEARRLAEAGTRRYVGVRGRVDAEETFEDEHHKPLVFRRSRLEAREGGGWRTLSDHREAVAFEVSEGLDRIRVDGDALDHGLAVIVRESEGTAGEIPDHVPDDLPPTTPVRLRVEHVSSVEHAIVLGVPGLDAGGEPILLPGLGRPLVLTTLEPAEAMRLLAGGRRRRAISVTSLLAGGLALVTIGLLMALVDAVA